MKQKFSKMSSDNKVKCYEVLYDTLDGLRDALLLLKIRKGHTSDEMELMMIRIKIAETDADIAKVNARIIAFKSNMYAMTPPSEETYEEIMALVKILDIMVAQAETADTIIAASANLIKVWNEAT